MGKGIFCSRWQISFHGNLQLAASCLIRYYLLDGVLRLIEQDVCSLDTLDPVGIPMERVRVYVSLE